MAGSHPKPPKQPETPCPYCGKRLVTVLQHILDTPECHKALQAEGLNAASLEAFQEFYG